MDQTINDCITLIKSYITDGNVSIPLTIFDIYQHIVPRAMTIVETYPALSGAQKEEIVCAAIKNIMETIPVNEEAKHYVDGFETFILPTLISLIINTEKRKIVIQATVGFFSKIKKFICSCRCGCCPCCRKGQCCQCCECCAHDEWCK